ncbi:tRNA (cytidine(56)-2'-O)-methyltransferase [Halovivax limisalsi]|uniref:tRNA (cytidine(56)-2'-O)-methyltransferase n=1 Tax=Halovivax limisalsi TaxID=1453760 RepID=UPI001FFD3764|nr:tRNA (cytidine(56)-2'-O)-methyltransferase [Halovivax limisalsi]
MEHLPEVAVCRLGHRPGRDDRMTTHVGLTARALGADRVVLPENATDAARTARDITDRFGGPFAVERTESPRGVVRNWDGRVVHLTMYGLAVQDVEDEVRTTLVDDREPLLIVVGAEKVPFEIYEAADWNVGVTNQPHSEVAGLAVFLDRLFDGAELDRAWEGADRRVVPKSTGKEVVSVEDEPADSTPT